MLINLAFLGCYKGTKNIWNHQTFPQNLSLKNVNKNTNHLSSNTNLLLPNKNQVFPNTNLLLPDKEMLSTVAILQKCKVHIFFR